MSEPSAVAGKNIGLEWEIVNHWSHCTKCWGTKVKQETLWIGEGPDPRNEEESAMKVSTTTSNSPKEDAMKEVTNTGKIYAGSGSRSLKLDPEMFNKVFTRLVEMIRQTKPSLIISGMAEGFDEALA